MNYVEQAKKRNTNTHGLLEILSKVLALDVWEKVV